MLFKRILILSTLVFSLFSAHVYASCDFYVHDQYTVNATKYYTLPLAASAISVPAGAAVGSVIFEQQIKLNSQVFSIKCDAVGDFYRRWEYASLPLPETSSGSQTYKTGIEGIGVRFHTGNFNFPSYLKAKKCLAANNIQFCDYTEGWTANSTLQFVKTGNVVSSGTIPAVNIPVALYTAGQDGSMVNIYQINVSGSLTVNVPTCDISTASQSMVVPMGKHHVADFSGIGSGTEWKNASIVLNNCGHFYGNSSTPITSFDGTSNIPLAGLTSNAAVVSLTPLDGKIKSEDGVMALSSSSSATGIGIQLSSSESENGKINLDTGYAQPLPKDGSPNVTIPLFARYIQTENAIGAGTANGKLEYTISYR